MTTVQQNEFKYPEEAKMPKGYNFSTKGTFRDFKGKFENCLMFRRKFGAEKFLAIVQILVFGLDTRDKKWANS
jgi:hypothetical protein